MTTVGEMGDSDDLGIHGRVRLVDEVAQRLRERIYSGAFPPGTKLRQEQLAEQLRVSRTPLREALRVLERDGLVQSEPGRGVRVIEADPAALIEAYNLREAVDGVAARLAAEHATPADVDRLHAHLAVQRSTVDPWDAAAYTIANVEFHTMVMELSANRYIMAELPLVRMTSQVFTPVMLVPEERGRAAVADHTSIVDAIAARDPQRAERLARAHIQETIARLTAAARPGEPAPEPPS
jgi:DNA-binding GntR family transcriptional regulator